MFTLSILNIILLFLLLIIERKNNSNNIFSPGSLFIYFAFLPAISNLYFSIFKERFDEVVLNLIASTYHDPFYAKLALFFTILGNTTIYIGIYIGSKSNNKFFTFLMNKILIFKYHRSWSTNNIIQQKKVFRLGLIIYFLGLIVYLIFIQKIGGLSILWQELHLRSTKNAGLGYYQTFYMFSIQFGSLLMLWSTFKNKRKYKNIFIILLTIFLLGSMGARGPVIIFLLSILIMYHYLIKRINKVLNIKIIFLLLLFPMFIVIMLQFRYYSFDYIKNNPKILVSKSIESFESGFVARVGRLERDIVILKYFSNNDFWWGKSYIGLIYAPIPRTLFPNKPPNDTGMYLRAMALGYKVEPPQPVSKLESSSWPEGNWVGYMNWGIPGFLIVFYFSGLLMGKYYRYIKNLDFPIIPTILFSYLVIGGPPILSPPGLIKLAMSLVITFLIILFIYIPIFKLKLKW
jgi:oligosaccharide repeat unit polymerase